MKYTAILFLVTVFLFTGCQTPQPPTGGNSNQPPAAPSAPASTTADLSPKDVLKALNTAAKQKNVAEIKRHLSQGTLRVLDKTAEEAGKTSDQILTEEGGAPFSVLPEMREEKIEGETATVEVQNMLDKKEYEKIPFVREAGAWKVALDVYMDDLERRITEDMKKPAKKPAPAVK
jgi:hypothetical protein